MGDSLMLKMKVFSSGSGSMCALVDEVLLLFPIVKFWMVDDGTIDNHGIRGEKNVLVTTFYFLALLQNVGGVH